MSSEEKKEIIKQREINTWEKPRRQGLEGCSNKPGIPRIARATRSWKRRRVSSNFQRKHCSPMASLRFQSSGLS